jgi:cell wall-associated NlpC family hydrolase
MVTARELVDKALGQRGKRYDEVPSARLDDPDPVSFDCSLLVQWACAQIGLAPPMPRTTWLQLQHCIDRGTQISLGEAEKTTGALLFTNRDVNGAVADPAAGRPRSGHVAISLGDGHTIEAMGTQWGVDTQTLTNRSFSHGALVPGLAYPVTATQPAAVVITESASAKLTSPTAGDGPASDESTWLVQGTMGGDVQLLQQRLRLVAARVLAGTDPLADYPATGDFGAITDIAVRLFQHHVKRHLDPTMDVDGKVGPATWKALKDLADSG